MTSAADSSSTSSRLMPRPDSGAGAGEPSGAGAVLSVFWSMVFSSMF